MVHIVSLLGDFYHPHDPLAGFLQKVIRRIDQAEWKDITVDELQESLAEKPDLFIISKENRQAPEEENENSWLTEEMDGAIADYVENGGKMLVLHSGLSAYPPNSRYQDLIKGKFLHHPKDHLPIEYVGFTPDFGEINFTLNNEHYFVEVEEEETEVFLRSKSEKGESFAGWRHSAGKGKILCLTSIHQTEDFESKEFEELLLQSIEWLIK